MSTLARLQAWYTRQCNGTWEHSSGIVGCTRHNPGWWVKIDLLGTPLQAAAFTEIAEGVDARRFALGTQWLSCYTKNGTWHGAGDEAKLERILEVFLAWAEANDS